MAITTLVFMLIFGSIVGALLAVISKSKVNYERKKIEYTSASKTRTKLKQTTATPSFKSNNTTNQDNYEYINSSEIPSLDTFNKINFVYSVAQLPNGQVVSSHKDSSVRIWNIKNEKSIHILKHDSIVRALAVLDGPKQRLVTGSNNIQIWHLNDGSLVKTLETNSSVWSLAVLNSEYLACGLTSSDIQIWNTVNGSLVKTLSGHSGQVNALATVKELMASASDDSTIKLWHLGTSQLIRTIGSEWGEVNALSVTFDDFLISGHSKAIICIWNVDNGALVNKLVGHRDAVFAFSFLANNLLASGSFDRTIRVWDLSEKSTIKMFQQDYYIWSLTLLSNGRLISGSDKLYEWNIDDGSLIRTFN